MPALCRRWVFSYFSCFDYLNSGYKMISSGTCCTNTFLYLVYSSVCPTKLLVFWKQRFCVLSLNSPGPLGEVHEVSTKWNDSYFLASKHAYNRAVPFHHDMRILTCSLTGTCPSIDMNYKDSYRQSQNTSQEAIRVRNTVLIPQFWAIIDSKPWKIWKENAVNCIKQ